VIEADLLSLSTLFLALAALAAGFVDAVAGGGGMIQVPALFAASPTSFPATLLGTNKVASIGGTLIAAKKYIKSVNLPYKIVTPAILSSFVGALVGAWVVKGISIAVFKGFLPVILTALLIYTVTQRSIGQAHAPKYMGRAQVAKALLLGGGIGFYDGVFGPGTGSFLLIGFIRIFGFDFLHASAATKLVNATTNLAAILLFASFGHIYWGLGFAMMLMNMLGAYGGAHFALKHGNQFVRKIFIWVVLALIIKTAYDAIAYGVLNK
jgi:uncharacterized membrane protein YfcA